MFYGGGRLHQRWTRDMIGFYTAAEDDEGLSRSEVGVAIEPYGPVPFSQTQSPRTVIVETSPQSSYPDPEMETYPKRNNKLIPLAFLLIHSVAILIFTRGFLLTRTELPFHSTCSDVSLSPNPPIHHSNSNQNQPKCWTKPVVDRVVIIVLDALRIDFLAPSAFFPEAKPWMDKLTVLQNLAFGNESSAKIFKAFADPPTTSLQRLKGLTTGGLPTFVDVGNSFGAPAIVEDNFINQLVLNGKRLVMMGDDTWTQLFPNQFHKSYPFPSFNVKDLDTVDNGCIEHLFPTLYKDDWDVLIAHFLGVDHAGHIFGVDSMPMINKLEQYNTVLERVVDILESQAGPGGVHENTMLIVMGDHGQTLNGDHGGGTAEEVETTMFAMSTKKHTPSVPPEFDTSSCKQYPDGKQMCISSIEQLDFAATLSALLGISFPFGSIGHVNPELYALGSSSLNLDNTKQPAVKEWMKSYVNVLCVNAWQDTIDPYTAAEDDGGPSRSEARVAIEPYDRVHFSQMQSLEPQSWKPHRNRSSSVRSDHAGHIFGVDSMPMINKLEQYNTVLERVVDILESQAGPGGVHENTMLIVMGDHGQTLNGDHGGGTAEEVETTMFAMSTKKHTPSVPPEFDTSSCKQDPDGKQMCISSIEQLDFAATLSALLGISFPFGSIGHVNPELYALGSSSLNLDNTKQPAVKEWMKSYVNVLCVNAWQVKRYIDVYSNSSVVGFSSDDMSRISNLYSAAEHHWSNSVKHILMYNDGNEDSTNTSALKAQIAAYLKFFSTVAELARSKWTEFNLSLMITGFGILVISLILQSLAIVHGDNKPYAVSSGLSTGAAFTLFIVLIRACSFLSNSYILEEGKVANFLLATTGLIKLRYSVMRKTMRKEAFVFLAMVSVLRVSIDIGLTKQAATSQFMSSSPTWMLGLAPDHPALTYAIEIAPILSVAALICVLYVAIARTHSEGIWKYVTVGSMLSYFLIALLWASESKIFGFDGLLQVIGGRNIIPQTVYVIGLVQLFLLASAHMFCSGKDKNWGSRTVALVSACSSPVILLSGKQGSMLALAYLLAGYCIMRLEGVERRTKSDGQNKFSKLDSVCVVQWSLLSVCMFFASGHWCAFDGLRYGAAFVGFDEFVLIRQAILLTIETFGFSIILSVSGLPLLIPSHGEKRHQLFQMYMLYGVISATTVTATILCVTIHRRHLMVWGLFAPKFVFDVVGLILTDVLICLASAFYL
ncbi:hypothetical protein DY000_02018782 [Brassica cretica]|uniref:GPI ethanolamine phosphate transferase 2 C-terminal domain-containing protein n=1 Tax=Brassica cretica TaxID=69181 RepID=A0ABQ7DBC2_BRACR|nr:hypothetical protein DY000_02018782 [Brassica cretica]